MFLKKTPIIDMNNEMLLKIVFSMLQYSKEEIAELDDARKQLPSYKIDSKKPRRDNSKNGLNTSKNSGSQGGTDPDQNTPKGASSKKLMDVFKQGLSNKKSQEDLKVKNKA